MMSTGAVMSTEEMGDLLSLASCLKVEGFLSFKFVGVSFTVTERADSSLASEMWLSYSSSGGGELSLASSYT